MTWNIIDVVCLSVATLRTLVRKLFTVNVLLQTMSDVAVASHLKSFVMNPNLSAKMRHILEVAFLELAANGTSGQN